MSLHPFTFPAGRPVQVPEHPGAPLVEGLESHIYVVEFDGHGVKVGHSAAPTARLVQHQRNGRNFGRTATRGLLTGPHTEAKRNERILLKLCREAAGMPEDTRGEYFPISFETATGFIAGLPQTRGNRDEYVAELERRGRVFVTSDSSELRRRRQLARFTVTEFARVTGYSRTHVSRLERGTHKAGPNFLRKAAEVLGCEPADLMTSQSPSEAVPA